MSSYSLSSFPPDRPLDRPLESEAVLRALVLAHRYLAELKGVAHTMPNEGLLVTTLSLQEAQSSSQEPGTDHDYSLQLTTSLARSKALL